MLGIEGKDLEPIHIMAKKFDPYPIYDTEKLGAWGILFLCCGALAARNSLWQDRAYKSDTFLCSPDLVKFVKGEKVCTSDEYALKFSECIKQWSNSSSALAVIEKGLDKSETKMSDKALLSHKTYLALAFMLNSQQEVTREELLGFDCKKWIGMSDSKVQNYGWPELFFAAGFILNKEPSVGWLKMASIIHGMGKNSFQIDVAPLYEHYAGENPFLKSGLARIRTDQLKKGTRVRMRNGWEAIVVEECDGNTLIAEVFGAFTETGSIYAHNIVAAQVDGKWVEVEMIEAQARFYKQVKPFLDGDTSIDEIVLKSQPKAVDWVKEADALWDGTRYTDPLKAIKYLSNIIKLHPDSAKAYNNRGITYADLGQYPQAIEDYKEAIRLNPHYIMAYNNRGLAYKCLGQQQRAIADFNEAIRLQPDLADAYYNRGINYVELGQYQRAIEDFNEAIRLEPNDADAYFERGNVYGKYLGAYQRGIENWSEAIRLNPDYVMAYYHRGISYNALGQQQRAIEDFNEAILLHPDLADAYYNRGNAYHSLGQQKRAIENYNEAIRLNPDDAMAYSNRGFAYLSQGENNLGCRDAHKACELGNCKLLEFAKSEGLCR